MAHPESPSVTVARRGSTPDDRDADCTIVWLHGEHDIATRVAVVVTIARAARRDDADLLVDLSGVTFMDASTIGALVGSRNRLRARSQSLLLRSPSPRARRVLDLCGLAHLVQVRTQAAHPTGAAAALGTWVDVPAMHSREEAVDPAALSEQSQVARRVHPAGARPFRTSPTTGADRGGR